MTVQEVQIKTTKSITRIACISSIPKLHQLLSDSNHPHMEQGRHKIEIEFYEIDLSQIVSNT